MPNLNTYNYTLVDFFSAGDFTSAARYNFDYVVQGKTLLIPRNSSFITKLSAINSSSNALITLYTTSLTALTSLNLNEPNLTVFTPPTGLISLSASNWYSSTSAIALTGSYMTSIFLSGIQTLTALDLSQSANIQSIVLASNANLSSIVWALPSLSSIATISLTGNNLNIASLNTMWTTLCSLCAGAPGRLTNKLTINLINPLTGNGLTNWAALTCLQTAGAAITYLKR